MMSLVDVIIGLLLVLGVFITWSSEALGSYIKLVAMRSNRNVVGGSLVQAASVLSRLGFFMQSFAFAWIIDSRVLMHSRLVLFLICLLVVFLSLIFLNFYGRLATHILFFGYHKLGIIEELDEEPEYSIKIDFRIRPPATYVFAYFLLYFGSFSALIIQTIDASFAARSVALSGVINGISTIILLSYIDVKYAHDVEVAGTSLIPMQLIISRYYALGILSILIAGMMLLLNN